MGPEFEDQVAEEEAMNGETWTNYEFQPAPRDLLCQFRRPGLDQVWVGYGRDIYLSSYATDLQWRLTGIARDITSAQWSGPRFFGLTKRAATARATPDNPLTGAQMVSENADG